MTLEDESLSGNAVNDSALKNSFRLVLLGAPKVGKTSIVNWFLGKRTNDGYIPTIEDFHRKIYKIRGEIYRLDILDTSGNDPFPAMKKLNIMTGDLFVLVFSIDDIDSYLQVKQLAEQIIELKKTKQSGNSLNIPILILGNKIDYLIDNKVSHRCVDLVDAQQFATSFKSCYFCEVSCKGLIGLEFAFEKLFNLASLPIEMVPSRHRRVSLNLDLTKPQFGKQALCATDSASSEGSSFQNNKNVSPKTGELGEREGSFKQTAKRSFRKMTFRPKLVEACGTVWLNARRPSIRAELKLLQVKTNGNFIYHTAIGLNSNKGKETRFQSVIQNLRNFFCCHKTPLRPNTSFKKMFK